MAFYTNSSMIGVDLNTPGADQLFALGTTVRGSDGSIWQYVVAAASCSAYSVVGINASASMSQLVLANIDSGSGRQIAVCQANFSASAYGWVPIHGGAAGAAFKVNVSGSATLGTDFYITTGSGSRLTTTAAASGTIKGITLATATEAWVGITAVACIITWPRVNTLGS